MIVKSPKTVYDFTDVIEYIDGMLTFGSRQISMYIPKGNTIESVRDITRREEKRTCSYLLTKSQASALRASFEEIRVSIAHAGEFSVNGIAVFSGSYRQNEDYTWGNTITIFVNPPVSIDKYKFDLGDNFKTIVIRDLMRKMK